MIRLIASDLDGTLLGPDFRFRPRTLAALRAASLAGLELVFVTGRPHRWLTPLREQLQHDSYAICSNGAVLYHMGSDSVERVELASMADIAAVHPVLEGLFPAATFIMETLDTVYIQGQQLDSPALDTARVIYGPLARSLDGQAGVVKYLLKLDGVDVHWLYRQVQPVVADRLSITAGLKDVPLVEMAKLGLHKGQVLAQFAADRGIKAGEVAAFGDMLNDVEMLQWAGAGYAMASGSSRLIKAVGRVCPGFDQDGVAQVIEAILADLTSQDSGGLGPQNCL